MRKILHLHAITHGIVSPPTSSSLPPAPATSPLPNYSDPFSFFPWITNADAAFDLATLSSIGGLLLLSTFSLSLVFRLWLRSRRLRHLQHFNYLWTVRLLLVTFASLWAVNELLRLPTFRREYLYLIFPTPPTLHQQANLCKLHVVLSLGFFEPGFLITLLFLVNVSIKKRLLPSRMWALAIGVCISCSPILLLQAIFVVYSPLESRLPELMHGSCVLQMDMYGKKTVLCAYPFFSCAIFGAFAIAYSLAFLISCWRVWGVVINRSIRARIGMLVLSLMITLPMQILCLALTFLWPPDDLAYCCAVLAMFCCVAWLLAVGMVILVIKPITDALAATERSIEDVATTQDERWRRR